MHKEELHNFHSSPSAIGIVKSRGLQCMEYVARTETCTYLSRKP